jgi:general secretion pathway protein A
MSEPDIPITRIGERAAPSLVREDAEDGRGAERKFLEYFGLNEQPFGVTPDPRFLYLGPKHRQALTALTYGTELNRGFLTLIAKPGMGKTSLLFKYLDDLRNRARTAFLFQTLGDTKDLMCYLLADLGLDGTGKDLPEMNAMLNQALLGEMNAGRPLIFVIDEAQNLDEKVLESVRLLSNFETPWMKLIQIILAGQPQLAERLAQPSMAQLRQRVSFSIRIEPFVREEVDAYIDHRLWVAGHKGQSLFSVGARTLIADRSEGIPRNISNICFCAMSLGWATKAKSIDREMMNDVISDLDPGPANEKIDSPTKVAQERQRVIPVAPQLPVLTVEDVLSRSWLARVGVATVVLLVLGWTGIHFNFGQRFEDSWHDVAAAVKSYIAPPPTPAALPPAALDISRDSLIRANSEAPAENKKPGPPLQGAIEASRPSQGTN